MRHTIGKHKEEIANGRDIYIMGIYKGTLLYFAKITKILSMREYFAPNSQYKNRHDYIYETLPDGFQQNDNNPKFKRNDNNPKFHPKKDIARHKRDWLGEYALLSDCFAYWGKSSKPISESLMDILPKHQENKHYKGDSDNGEQIIKKIEEECYTHGWDFKTIIQGVPHDGDLKYIIQNDPHGYPGKQSCKRC